MLHTPRSRARGHLIEGASHGGVEGKDAFTISIRLPKNVRLEALKDQMVERKGRLVFKIPIEKHFDQITIRWPRGKNGQ